VIGQKEKFARPKGDRKSPEILLLNLFKKFYLWPYVIVLILFWNLRKLCLIGISGRTQITLVYN
jgi:hypothetical protein